MKIILCEDVKGKGKKDQVVNAPDGYANFLIKSGKAMLASDANMVSLEKKKEQEAIDAALLLKEMQSLKGTLESQPLVIKAKASSEGALFGSISTKVLAEEYKKTFGVDIDKRKISTNIPISGLGTYTVNIELHKQVKAECKVRVEAL